MKMGINPIQNTFEHWGLWILGVEPQTAKKTTSKNASQPPKLIPRRLKPPNVQNGAPNVQNPNIQTYLVWWGLLADRYGLPIGDYWQTVHNICKWSANLLLLADPWCSIQKSIYYCTPQLRQRASARHLQIATFSPGTGGLALRLEAKESSLV